MAALLFVVSCAPGQEGSIQETRHGVVVEGEAPAGFAAEAEELMRRLEAWRGRTYLRPVVASFVRAAPEKVRRGGWYDTAARKLVVVGDESEKFQRGTLLHELHHALQDQHFDLMALHRLSRDDDMAQAVRALIEGEAMLAVAEILDYDFRAHAKLPPDGPLDPERFKKIFEYGTGMDFVRALRDQGGWKTVDGSFQRPPETTGAVYHPKRDAMRDRIEPELLPPRLESPARIIRTRVLGEYALRLLLAQSPKTRQKLGLATPLVGGRAFEVACNSETGADSPEHHWVLVFASDDDTQRFHDALVVASESVRDITIDHRTLRCIVRP